MKKQLIIVITILLICVILSGCNRQQTKTTEKSDEARITGTWFISELFEGSLRTITYIFSPDNIYKVIGTYKDFTESFNGTWKIDDNKLIVTIEGQTLTGNYQFSNNDKTLTITDIVSNTSTVLTRQE